MCMMCMILSPNYCTVTIVEYSSTDVTLLRSCLSVLSEHVASQSKWQSADLDFLKLAKKRKSVCSALFRGNVCLWSDKISNVSAILGRKSTARSKVNQNTRLPPLSESLKLRKRMGFSVLGSLITVPLHSTLAVNNLGLKFVSWNVWLNSCLSPRVFVAISICRLTKFASVFQIIWNTAFKHGRVFNSVFIGFLNPSTWPEYDALVG